MGPIGVESKARFTTRELNFSPACQASLARLNILAPQREAIEVDTSMPSARVIRVVDQVRSWRPLPRSIRVDNGPEFIAEALANWCQHHDVVLNFIPPG